MKGFTKVSYNRPNKLFRSLFTFFTVSEVKDISSQRFLIKKTPTSHPVLSFYYEYPELTILKSLIVGLSVILFFPNLSCKVETSFPV